MAVGMWETPAVPASSKRRGEGWKTAHRFPCFPRPRHSHGLFCPSQYLGLSASRDAKAVTVRFLTSGVVTPNRLLHMVMYVVVGLLVMIVILLCTPLRQRGGVVRVLAGVAVFGLVAYYLAPLGVGLVVVAYQYALEHYGWKGTLAFVAVGLFVVSLYYGWKSDRKHNKAIKAGSVEAFNRRVEAYKRDPFNYEHEKAVEATVRIRDEK
jgi:hypothetical protein